MAVYLSIDLDYWNIKSGLSKFINKVIRTKDIIVCTTHQYMVSHINEMGEKYKLTKLINIDFHSDLVPQPCICNEASWASFVNWRFSGSYEWRCPSLQVCVHNKQGICHSENEPDPFKNNVTGWNKLNILEGLQKLPWGIIRAAGITISDEWTEKTSELRTIVKLLQSHKNTTKWCPVWPIMQKTFR